MTNFLPANLRSQASSDAVLSMATASGGVLNVTPTHLLFSDAPSQTKRPVTTPREESAVRITAETDAIRIDVVRMMGKRTLISDSFISPTVKPSLIRKVTKKGRIERDNASRELDSMVSILSDELSDELSRWNESIVGRFSDLVFLDHPQEISRDAIDLCRDLLFERIGDDENCLVVAVEKNRDKYDPIAYCVHNSSHMLDHPEVSGVLLVTDVAVHFATFLGFTLSWPHNTYPTYHEILRNSISTASADRTFLTIDSWWRRIVHYEQNGVSILQHASTIQLLDDGASRVSDVLRAGTE